MSFTPFPIIISLLFLAPLKKPTYLSIYEKQSQNHTGKQLATRYCQMCHKFPEPNLLDKKSKRYSNTNPPFLLEEVAIYLKEKGIKHLLIDLPSVDKEKDNGELVVHNAFWNTKGELRMDATITEFIYVPNTVDDGEYLLNLMIAPFENDATPSKPVLYKIENQ